VVHHLGPEIVLVEEIALGEETGLGLLFCRWDRMVEAVAVLLDLLFSALELTNVKLDIPAGRR